MKFYCKIGGRTKWRNKQYRCVEFKGIIKGGNCMLCGLRADRGACHITACMSFERADKKAVFFRLEPRFRKEVLS